jgi:hypothetical protein
MLTIILIILIVLLIGGGGYGWHAQWGPGPFGGFVGLILLAIVILLLVGRVR